MNSFKPVVAFLAYASLVSGAAYGDIPDVLQTALPEVGVVEHILEDGDNPAALEALFGEQRIPFAFETSPYFESAMINGRTESYRFLLSRLDDFPNPRACALSHYVNRALHYGNLALADVVLEEDLPMDVHKNIPNWVHHADGISLSLPEIKQFIANHARQAAALAPMESDFQLATSAKDIAVLTELSHYCDEISGGQHTFDPTQHLFLLLENGDLCDAQMAEAAGVLLACGAAADGDKQDFIDKLKRWHPDYQHTIEVIQNFDDEDIKYPSED